MPYCHNSSKIQWKNRKKSKILYGLDNRINLENQELKFNWYPMKYHIQMDIQSSTNGSI
jgi:hypothetical protein